MKDREFVDKLCELFNAGVGFKDIDSLVSIPDNLEYCYIRLKEAAHFKHLLECPNQEFDKIDMFDFFNDKYLGMYRKNLQKCNSYRFTHFNFKELDFI